MFVTAEMTLNKVVNNGDIRQALYQFLLKTQKYKRKNNNNKYLQAGIC